MLENEHVKMSWYFEHKMKKESTARRSDVTIQYKEIKVIHLVDMNCPSRKNALEKMRRKNRSISSSPLRIDRDEQDTEWK